MLYQKELQIYEKDKLRKYKRFEHLSNKAEDKGQLAVAVNAEFRSGQMAEMFVNKSEVRTGSIDAMSEDEIRAELSRLSEEASKNTVVLPPEAFEDITESGSGNNLDESGHALHPDDND